MKLTIGQRVADAVTALIGSWRFILIQTSILTLWVIYNIYVRSPFDPYPFILLNLMLSFQAAYAAPFIMMSQNRQQEIDRKVMNGDYTIDKKTHQLLTRLHLDVHKLIQKMEPDNILCEPPIEEL